MKEIECG